MDNLAEVASEDQTPLNFQNIKLNELLVSLDQIKPRQTASMNIPTGTQLSAISPFKRNNLLHQSSDNLSVTSSVSSWTDKSCQRAFSPRGKYSHEASLFFFRE